MNFDFNTVFEAMMEGHHLDKVLLLGHMNPDGDACGSVMGLAHYIRVNYPQYRVFPYLAETLDRGPKEFVLQDRIFDPFQKPELTKAYGVICCDTATKARMIGREYYEGAAASIVIDHHAGNEGYGDVNYTKISEACSENIFFTLDPVCLKKAAEEKEHPNAAEYIYLGILHDTGGFQRAKVTTMKAASELLELGVDHSCLMKTLQTDTLSDQMKKAELMAGAVLALKGQVAYVVIDQKSAKEKGITYEDIHPISGMLRDCADIRLGFTMYEEAPDHWRCSFRSDEKWINVNELLTPFGGGGHAAAAGLSIKSTEPEKLREELLKAIAEAEGDRR